MKAKCDKSREKKLTWRTLHDTLRRMLLKRYTMKHFYSPIYKKGTGLLIRGIAVMRNYNLP